jgi:hypothetical protein
MSLVLQELGIVIIMQQPNPHLITAEFIKLSGMILLNWQLARGSIPNDRISQLLFTAGIEIAYVPDLHSTIALV